jgi:NAD-dependent SIR2 family protein deacetylase
MRVRGAPSGLASLAELVLGADSVVALTGAGISAFLGKRTPRFTGS